MSFIPFKNQTAYAIGLMSGTSIDGLDITYCKIQHTDNQWDYQIIVAETIPYSGWWKKKLSHLFSGTAEEFSKTNTDLGHFFGQEILLFQKRHQITEVDLIASHGHTIFHNPKQQFTTQIGDLSAINAITGIPTVGDFRSKDVALGGNGAPLVPVGDQLLFSEYSSCLNLGGFANISYSKSNTRIAFDCCPVNMAINYFTNQLNIPFDNKGAIAKENDFDADVLERLNLLNFYHLSPPKSLGREWFEESFLPLILAKGLDAKTAISTCTEHAAQQISKQLVSGNNLVTGGGAYNDYLIDRIKFHSPKEVHLIIPESNLIEFKEALIFAFLGTLKMLGKINVLKSVTGAKIDHSSGAIYL